MILVRCLRMDRVEKAATMYVANALGRKYVEPPTLDLAETHADSTRAAPLIFVLSPGVDPTANLKQLAQAQGVADRFFSVALGQGQAPVATKLIDDADARRELGVFGELPPDALVAARAAEDHRALRRRDAARACSACGSRPTRPRTSRWRSCSGGSR